MLPSFLYLPASGELPDKALTQLPWGGAGRRRGRRSSRSSAAARCPTASSPRRSRGCRTAAADRTGADPALGQSRRCAASSRRSTSSARYLAHIRGGLGRAASPTPPLAEQDVLHHRPGVVRSGARELTVRRRARRRAAAACTVLEEPQAALLRVDRRAAATRWREAVQVGDVILVCDVGGGTTDFSLIAVREDGRRVAARAHRGRRSHPARRRQHGSRARLPRARAPGAAGHSARRLAVPRAGRELPRRRRSGCSPTAAIPALPIAILGRGRKVVGGALRTERRARRRRAALVDGFFPRCALGDRPQAPRRAGLQELGLPYAADPAVTRHLAHFLRRQADASGAATDRGARSTAASCAPAALRSALVDVLGSWFARRRRRARAGRRRSGARRARAARPTTACARRGRGVRIRGGVARDVLPRHRDARCPPCPASARRSRRCASCRTASRKAARSSCRRASSAWSSASRPSSASSSSSTRRDDHVGTLLDTWDDDEVRGAAAARHATLEWQGHEAPTVPVHLQARVNEVGVLELWFVSRDERATLEARIQRARRSVRFHRVRHEAQRRVGRELVRLLSKRPWKGS